MENKRLVEIVQKYRANFTKTSQVYCGCEGGGIYCGIDFETANGDVTGDYITVFSVVDNESPNIADWEAAVETARILSEISGLPIHFGTKFKGV